jgi:hypothetical protein
MNAWAQMSSWMNVWLIAIARKRKTLEEQQLTQGLKPATFPTAWGMTEVMPCYKTWLTTVNMPYFQDLPFT